MVTYGQKSRRIDAVAAWNRRATPDTAGLSGGDAVEVPADLQGLIAPGEEREKIARALDRLDEDEYGEPGWDKHDASGLAYRYQQADMILSLLAQPRQPDQRVERLREAAVNVARRWAEHYAGGEGEHRRMERLCDDIADEIAALSTPTEDGEQRG